MKFRYILPLLMLMISPAIGADKTKEIKLTTEQAFVLADILRNKVTSYEVAAEGGKASQKFYQFEVSTRMAFARNLQALEYITKTAEKAREGQLMELSGGSGVLDPKIPEQVPLLAKLQASWTAVLNQVNSFNLILIGIDELKLKENTTLPVPVISALAPIISE